MTAGQRILDTGTGVVYEATAALAGVQAYANSTRWLTGDIVSDSDNFWIADKDIAEADFTSGAGLSAGELAAIVTNDVVLNSTQGVVYKALANLGATTSFNSGTAANAGDLLEDGGSYYKFTNDFWGTFNNGDVITGGPAVANDLVFSGGTFWTAGGASDLNNFRTKPAVQTSGSIRGMRIWLLFPQLHLPVMKQQTQPHQLLRIPTGRWKRMQQLWRIMITGPR